MFKPLQTRSHIMRALTAGSCAALGLALVAADASAQNTRWQPWVGCWAPSMSGGASASAAANGMLCVVPSADGNDVDLATVANGKVVHLDHVSATGTQISKTIDNCPGWESATWSADNHRVFLRSEFTCAATAKVKGSGIFAINADGEFLQIQGTSVGGNANARAIRYQSAGVGVVLRPGQALADSAIVTTAPLTTGFAAQSMRVAAGTPITSESVIDASKHVDEAVASAWLTEMGQPFAVNGKELVKLADAGVPSYTIDLMVALSYPDRYSVRRNGAQVRGGSAMSSGVTVTNGGSRADRSFDSRYVDGYWDCGYGSRMFSYGYYSGGCNSMSYYDRYAFGSSYGYGYNPYYYGQQPVVIVVKGDGSGSGDGTSPVQRRAVKGQGYTHTGGTTTTTTSSAPKTSTSSSSGSSSSSGGSSSSGAAAAAASGGEARTAKPRNPPPPPIQ